MESYLVPSEKLFLCNCINQPRKPTSSCTSALVFLLSEALPRWQWRKGGQWAVAWGRAKVTPQPRSDGWWQGFIVQCSKEHLCLYDGWDLKWLQVLYTRQNSTKSAHRLGLSSGIRTFVLNQDTLWSLPPSFCKPVRQWLRGRQNRNDLF